MDQQFYQTEEIHDSGGNPSEKYVLPTTRDIKRLTVVSRRTYTALFQNPRDDLKNMYFSKESF